MCHFSCRHFQYRLNYYTTVYKLPSESSIHFYHFISIGNMGWQDAGYTLDRSPVYHKATQKHRQPFTHKDNLEQPISLSTKCMSLDRVAVGQDPGKHRDNMQNLGIKPLTSCCEATAPTTAMGLGYRFFSYLSMDTCAFKSHGVYPLVN